MLTAERPFSRQGAPASSKGWCNLNTASLMHLVLFSMHLHCYFTEQKSKKLRPCEVEKEQKCLMCMIFVELLCKYECQSPKVEKHTKCKQVNERCLGCFR